MPNKLSAAGFASMVLFAMVNMTVLLELLGSTRWTRIAHDHSYLLASMDMVGGSRQQYQGFGTRALHI
jgi:hypothetical protein